ncbi:hypothetical protein [Joostella sp. CR20]|uniref:hypothetical protein n=1 Tax=Joostella sp. CR20 TaxID=2804312 RepID=UPI00313AF4B9
MTNRFTYFSIIIFTFLSCSGEKTFDFEIENKTEYDIDILEFGCGFEKKSIKIHSFEKTTTELIYKQTSTKYFASKTFKEPEICITILKYSDSANNYTNSIGNAIGINQFYEKNLNRIEITSRNDERHRFKIKIINE